MSDRVGYVVGDDPDRDVAYWPLVLRNQIYFSGGVAPDYLVNGIWPQVGWTREQYMQAAWRIREWTFELHLSTSVTFQNTVIPETLNITGLIMGYYPSGSDYTEFATKEADLLGAPSWTIPAFNEISFPLGIMSNGLRNNGVALGPSYQRNNDGYVVIGQILDCDLRTESGDCASLTLRSCFLFGRKWPLIWDPASKLFYPVLIVSGTLFIRYPGPGALGQSIGSNKLDGAAYIDGTLTIKFSGQPDIVIPWFYGGKLGSGSLPGSFSMTLKPSRWWAYENKSGQPVYDEGSGAQINDPFA